MATAWSLLEADTSSAPIPSVRISSRSPDRPRSTGRATFGPEPEVETPGCFASVSPMVGRMSRARLSSPSTVTSPRMSSRRVRVPVTTISPLSGSLAAAVGWAGVSSCATAGMGKKRGGRNAGDEKGTHPTETPIGRRAGRARDPGPDAKRGPAPGAGLAASLRVWSYRGGARLCQPTGRREESERGQRRRGDPQDRRRRRRQDGRGRQDIGPRHRSFLTQPTVGARAVPVRLREVNLRNARSGCERACLLGQMQVGLDRGALQQQREQQQDQGCPQAGS